jgi:ABC-type transport system substrate-binding protein
MVRTSRRIVSLALLAVLALLVSSRYTQAQTAPETWRQASDAELISVLPARAPVEKEHIETEMRTASGIVNAHGQHVAGVVLITAGYAADGKYSHFFSTDVPLQMDDLSLQPGDYAIGWQRSTNGIKVHFYNAATGDDKGAVEAKPLPSPARVESFRIWPPRDRSIIQIGRFAIPYRIQR